MLYVSLFFENLSKLDQTLVMQVLQVGPDRIIAITNVSGSQGHCTIDMRCWLCRPGESALRTSQKSQTSRETVGYCTIDIVDVFGRVPSPTG